MGPQNRAKTSPFRHLDKVFVAGLVLLSMWRSFCPKQLGGWQSFLWLQKRPQARKDFPGNPGWSWGRDTPQSLQPWRACVLNPLALGDSTCRG